MAHFVVRLTVLLSFFTPVFVAWAGQLALGTPIVEGNEISIPVVLNSNTGKGVAAMNFTVSYDPAVLEPKSALQGTAAVPADRQLHANLAEPGSYVVVMMGLSQQTVTEGEVARLLFQRKDANVESTALSLVNTAFAALDGTEVPSYGSDAVLQFTGPKEEPAPETPPTDDPAPVDPSPPTDETPANDEDPAAPAPPVDGNPIGGLPETEAPPLPLPATPPQSGAPSPSLGLASPEMTDRKDRLVAALDSLTDQARSKQEALSANHPGPDPVRVPTAPQTASPRTSAVSTDALPVQEVTAPAVPAEATALASLAMPSSAVPQPVETPSTPPASSPPGVNGNTHWAGIAGLVSAVVLIVTVLTRRGLFGR
ncbi:MAG: hypothetical protein AMXMBFR84_16470 [Candidatus Hydrogenedentota bacterium]